ncbi:hypothetical protein [Magnetospirillum molischianum]|uniref:Uncharacterized protein n=1 Tax=Magnetospirillum molischianum DSM 120 TaxID=1150626 RepID=H8FXU3_MAGML|nr:hypothetical protein [Magnetospirillum molischianum]CCG43181.1 hypothetical protein PHAMO_60003 [Magnetospirillum molischianum DSM 120]
MPARAEGIDQYKHIHNVACLLAINPKPSIVNLLSKFTGISSSEIYFATKFAYTYQTIGRGSLRDRNCQHPIKLVVLSKAEADKLAELFLGAQVVGQIGNLHSLRSLEKEVKRSSENKRLEEWSNKHRVAYSKYKKRITAKGGYVLDKEDWLEQERLPRLG